MNRITGAFGLTAYSIVVLWFLSGANRADELYEKEIKEAGKEILELSVMVEKGKDISTRAAAMRKKYDEIDPVMWCFKAKSKGGIGVGKKDPRGSMEVKIHKLGKRTLTRDQLASEKADLIKLASVSAAVAEVTIHYAPSRRIKDGIALKEWKRSTSEMKKTSLELMAAVKSGDPGKVKKAAGKLSDSCDSCHSVGGRD